MSFRDRLVNIVKSQMNEGVDSTADIIANNIVSSFDDMGMANVTPGEFSQEEITDKENLVNTANMSNDNNFDNENSGDSFIDMAKEVMNDIVDISGDDSDVAAVEITKSIDGCDDKEHEHECECGHKHKGIFGESKLATIIENALGGKTCEQYMSEWNFHKNILDSLVAKSEDDIPPFTPDKNAFLGSKSSGMIFPNMKRNVLRTLRYCSATCLRLSSPMRISCLKSII